MKPHTPSTFTKNLLSSAIFAALALPAVSAFAQEEEEKKPEFEQIMVTAQKRSENVQDVGVAISTVYGKMLEDANVNNVADLQNIAPGIQIGQSFGFAQIMVRGIGTDNPFAGGDPSVGMHFDGVITGQSSAQFGSLFDIDRVEVLRGPQGTLYGRNTTGGSINVITRRPTDHMEGYFRLTAGNYGLFKTESAIGGPLSDNLMGRLAVRTVNRDGYGTNIADGSDIDDANQKSVRGQLLWQADDDFSVRFAAEYHKEDDANYVAKFRSPSYDPAPLPALEPQPVGSSPASNPRDINSNVELQNFREQSSFTLDMNWDMSEEWAVNSITNFQTFEKIPQGDFDLTDADFYIWSESFDVDQFSEELRFTYTTEKLRAIMGLYYYSEEINSDNRLDLNLVPAAAAAANPTLAGCTFDDNQSDVIIGAAPEDLCFLFRGSSETEAFAAFANVAYDLTETLTLTVGGRYSYEDKEGDTDWWTAPGAPVLTFQDQKSFNEFSPSVRLEWDVNEDVMVYGGYSEGFKSGIFLSGQRTPVLDPELMDAYELGLKGFFFDGTVKFNTALFRYDYTDLQQGRSVPAGSSGFTLVYENAASASVNGFEFETSWLATAELRFDASFTYLDSEFDDYVSTDPFDTVYQQLGLIEAGVDLSQQLAGNRMVQAPEYAWKLAVNYETDLSENWYLSTNLSAAYKDDVFFTQFNNEDLGQEANTLVDANVKFADKHDRWSINLWAKNLTDEELYVGTFILNSSRTNAGFMAPPRTFGVTVNYNFE